MRVAMAALMTAQERFLFDLNGFLVLRGVLSPDEVKAANTAVDLHASQLHARSAAALQNAEADTPLAAAGPRLDMGGMLYWQKPHCDPFRSILAHPTLVPYLTALLGDGYRLDHQPLLIAQDGDSEGFKLHGGPLTSSGQFNPELQYRFSGGTMWNSLLAVSVQLTDHGPGDGGFCVVRGSHKLNLPVPDDFANGASEAFRDHIHQPTTRAGDVVLFSEATVRLPPTYHQPRALLLSGRVALAPALALAPAWALLQRRRYGGHSSAGARRDAVARRTSAPHRALPVCAGDHGQWARVYRAARPLL
jgi:hypothetical protein